MKSPRVLFLATSVSEHIPMYDPDLIRAVEVDFFSFFDNVKSLCQIPLQMFLGPYIPILPVAFSANRRPNRLPHQSVLIKIMARPSTG